MDDEVDSLVLRVRADTRAFAGDVGEMRRQLDGPLAEGAGTAGRAIAGALGRAVTSGKLGFDDLKRVALSALADIAQGVVERNLGLGGSAAGVAGGLSGLIGGLVGSPGRATGGPVTGGRAYVVGERGPELFVPAAAGRVETLAPAAGGRGPVSITVNVQGAGEGAGPQALARSGQQVARAVARALNRAERA